MIKKLCSIDGCDNKHSSKGYCNKHYLRLKQHGDPNYRKTPERAEICSVVGCNSKHFAKSYCSKHYARYRRYGDPSVVKHKRTEKGKVNRINEYGYRLVSVPEKFWVKGGGNSNVTGEHRVVMMEYLGRRLTPEESVHHKNGDKLDNRLENLELWTSSHPSGQRVEDKLKWADEIISMYRN